MELKILWASMYGNAEYVAARVEKMATKKIFPENKISKNELSSPFFDTLKVSEVQTTFRYVTYRMFLQERFSNFAPCQFYISIT